LIHPAVLTLIRHRRAHMLIHPTALMLIRHRRAHWLRLVPAVRMLILPAAQLWTPALMLIQAAAHQALLPARLLRHRQQCRVRLTLTQAPAHLLPLRVLRQCRVLLLTMVFTMTHLQLPLFQVQALHHQCRLRLL